jgi:hypothetical protein
MRGRRMGAEAWLENPSSSAAAKAIDSLAA